MKPAEDKPKLTLPGANPSLIVSAAMRAAILAGWSDQKIREILNLALSGGYYKFIRTICNYFDVCL